MKTLLAILSFTMSGCAAVSQLPSMEYCNKVKYERNERIMTITAECIAPYGGSHAF